MLVGILIPDSQYSRVAIRPEVLFTQYISYFSDDVMKVEFESWNVSAKSVRAATKKQLECANRSQFNDTCASSGVEAVNTRITVTRTQKQDKFDVSMYCESIWHISFRHECRL